MPLNVTFVTFSEAVFMRFIILDLSIHKYGGRAEKTDKFSLVGFKTIQQCEWKWSIYSLVNI